MKRILTIVLLIGLYLISSCKKEIIYEIVNQDGLTIFTKQKEGNIGDVMPFYHDNEWYLFYLHDSPPKPGFHPWYMLSTKNFYEFKDYQEIIPVVHDLESQELALGTGSVIEKDGIFYAFYTAHNGRLLPKEMFMLSISNDNMISWEKQDFIIDPRTYGFNINDFRDPHVVYIPERNLYYMLFTTRYAGKGAIGYLISDDLINWEKENDGIFFINNHETGTSSIDSNLECPTLWYFNGYWYLTFSEQWPLRVTRYLYKKNFSDDWIKPNVDTFDGAGLYAGKVGYSEEKMILAGWVSHNFNRPNEFGWGGNLIAHELKQSPNGTLFVNIISTINEKFNHPQPLTIEDTNLNNQHNSKITFTQNNFFDYISFNELDDISIIKGNLNITNINGSFGIFFDYRENASSFYYDFDIKNNTVSFYKGNFKDKDNLCYTHNHFYNTSSNLEFVLLFEEATDSDGSIVSLYLQDQMVLTGRMPHYRNVNFGFYSNDSDITITNLKKYK
ncbi:MAG: hypothetical protein GX931_01235 [Acholeplasmataceae bacterium]|jgi:beta-fructofuranosidase|nr:hypothetical protein [Acholeplasmataceae bacterium]